MLGLGSVTFTVLSVRPRAYTNSSTERWRLRLQLPDNPEGLGTLGRLVPHRPVAVPLPPQPGVDVVLAEAVRGLHHLALEGLPAHLAVRDDGEAGPLLQPDGPVHRPVFDALELGRGEPTRGVAFARLEQLLGSKRLPTMSARAVTTCFTRTSLAPVRVIRSKL